ncbi:MAG: hypothetical protein ABGX83_05515 [Nitrospira sp.]
MSESNQILTQSVSAAKSSVVNTGGARHHTFEVVFTDSVAPTVVVVTFRGSIIDGLSTSMKEVLAHTFTAPQLTAKSALIFLPDKLFQYLEVEVTTQTGGTSVLYDVHYQGAR